MPIATNTPPRSTVWAVTSILCTVIIVIGGLAWAGRDIGPIAGFLLAIVPGTVSSLIAIRQNDKLIADAQVIKANVNGNLSRLIELATDQPGIIRAIETSGRPPAEKDTPSADEQ